MNEIRPCTEDVTYNADGTVEVGYVPWDAGEYDLHVERAAYPMHERMHQVYWRPARGSPFKVAVAVAGDEPEKKDGSGGGDGGGGGGEGDGGGNIGGDEQGGDGGGGPLASGTKAGHSGGPQAGQSGEPLELDRAPRCDGGGNAARGPGRWLACHPPGPTGGGGAPSPPRTDRCIRDGWVWAPVTCKFDVWSAGDLLTLARGDAPTWQGMFIRS